MRISTKNSAGRAESTCSIFCNVSIVKSISDCFVYFFFGLLVILGKTCFFFLLNFIFLVLLEYFCSSDFCQILLFDSLFVINLLNFCQVFKFFGGLACF